MLDLSQRIADAAARAARAALGLDPEATTVALLPGSRASEVELLSGPMIGAATLLRERRPGLQFVSAMANDRTQTIFERALQGSERAGITLIQDRPRQVMAAADVVLCASGTATLETMLVNRPMVMAYRLALPTYLMAKHLKLIRPQHFALPNILAGEALVPELMQDEANAEALAREASRWLDNPEETRTLRRRFDELHQRLRRDAGEGQQVVLAERVEGDVLDHHHLRVVHVEDGIVEHVRRRQRIAGGELGIHALDARGSARKTGAVGVLADGREVVIAAATERQYRELVGALGRIRNGSFVPFVTSRMKKLVSFPARSQDCGDHPLEQSDRVTCGGRGGRSQQAGGRVDVVEGSLVAVRGRVDRFPETPGRFEAS